MKNVLRHGREKRKKFFAFEAYVCETYETNGCVMVPEYSIPEVFPSEE